VSPSGRFLSMIALGRMCSHRFSLFTNYDKLGSRSTCKQDVFHYSYDKKFQSSRPLSFKLAILFLLTRLLHSERENIPDVPAVYFCIPTEDNVDRICRDLQSNLYDNYFLNFMTPIPRQQIEDLASAAWQSNSGNAIQKVCEFIRARCKTRYRMRFSMVR